MYKQIETFQRIYGNLMQQYITIYGPNYHFEHTVLAAIKIYNPYDSKILERYDFIFYAGVHKILFCLWVHACRTFGGYSFMGRTFLCVVYCPSIDFMTGVTDIFRIKFRPVGLTVVAENLKIFLLKESKISWWINTVTIILVSPHKPQFCILSS